MNNMEEFVTKEELANLERKIDRLVERMTNNSPDDFIKSLEEKTRYDAIASYRTEMLAGKIQQKKIENYMLGIGERLTDTEIALFRYEGLKSLAYELNLKRRR